MDKRYPYDYESPAAYSDASLQSTTPFRTEKDASWLPRRGKGSISVRKTRMHPFMTSRFMPCLKYRIACNIHAHNLLVLMLYVFAVYNQPFLIFDTSSEYRMGIIPASGKPTETDPDDALVKPTSKPRSNCDGSRFIKNIGCIAVIVLIILCGAYV